MGDKNINDLNLYQNSEDEEELMKLPETQREKILYNRYIRLVQLEEKKEMDNRVSLMEERKNSTERKNEALPKKEGDVPAEKEDDTITYDMFCGIVIKRDMLAKNIYRPVIDNLVGNYVRICFENGYVIKKVEAVERGEEYAINYNGADYRTNKCACIRHSNSRMDKIAFSFISNSNPSYAEYDRFKEEHAKISLSKVYKKAEQFISTLSKIQPEEKEAIADERSRFVKQRRRNLMEKIRLIREREDAFKKGNAELYKKIQKRIDKIDEMDRDPKEEKEREIWEKINEKHKKINYERGVQAHKEKEKKKGPDDIYNPCIRRERGFK